MVRFKVILYACLFVLIVSFLFDTGSYAQSREPTDPSTKRFEISFGGGWGLYRMTNINKHYIDELARFGGIFDGHIDNGPNLSVGVGYFISPKVSINLGVTYLRGAISNTEDFIVTGYDYQGGFADTLLVEGSLTTTLVAPELEIKYHFPIEKMDLFFGGGTAWCFGRCVLESTVKSQEGSTLGESPYTAQGIGFLASTGASYNLNKTISFGAEIGYRYFATGDLKEPEDKSGEEQKVGTYASEILHKTNLDFSGPFILGSLSIRL
jgi:opacity protein-like surface antigen